MNVTANAVVLAAHHQSDFAMRFQADEAEDDVNAGFLQLARQTMLRSSSSRAFNSMTAVTCLPLSAARCSARTTGESLLVRYSVSLTAKTSLIIGRRIDEIDDVAERFIRMVQEDVAVADGRP